MNDIWRYEQRKAQIGKRIKDERLKGAYGKKKLSQQELADTISAMLNSDPDCKGIGQNTVSNWEKGITLPPLSKLIALSNIFSCDIGYLLCDYDEPTRNLADVADQTGLSREAIEKLQSLKEIGASEVLSVLSNLISDIRFLYALKDIRDAKDSYMSKEPMSDTVQMVKIAIEVENKYREHPGDTIISPKERCEMKLYHASQKFSNCAERIVKSNN